MPLFNLKSQKKYRQLLRKGVTKAESLLWKELRRKKLGFKFRRQFGIGPYITDFYCPQLRFAVELDGDVHTSDSAQKKDKIRDKFFNDCGVTVKRFWNHQIYEDIDSVLGEICYLCQQLNENKTQINSLTPLSPPKFRGRYSLPTEALAKVGGG